MKGVGFGARVEGAVVRCRWKKVRWACQAVDGRGRAGRKAVVCQMVLGYMLLGLSCLMRM